MLAGQMMVMRGLRADDGNAVLALHREQPRLGGGIGGHGAVAREMIGGDVEQHRHLAGEAFGDLELITRQFEDIDTARGQRVLREDRQADVAAHRCRHAGLDEDVVDERRRRRLPVGTGDADDAVWGKVRAGLCEQLDIADHRHACGGGAGEDGGGVRHAWGNDDRGQPGQVGGAEVGQFAIEGFAGGVAIVPGEHLCARSVQGGHGRAARAGEPEDARGLSGEGGGRDHRSFSVARPASASTMAMIQKRMTTVDSAQPLASK
ncbi:hypothetical protein GCM10007973_30770 [Polymorphobacter multimanifer]|nr:hypothetical protein GCM10007973_30770 [Polymorphobacter multimanifer]